VTGFITFENMKDAVQRLNETPPTLLAALGGSGVPEPLVLSDTHLAAQLLPYIYTTPSSGLLELYGDPPS